MNFLREHISELNTKQKVGILSGGSCPQSWRSLSEASNMPREWMLPLADSYLVQIQWEGVGPEGFPLSCGIPFINLTSQIQFKNCKSVF